MLAGADANHGHHGHHHGHHGSNLKPACVLQSFALEPFARLVVTESELDQDDMNSTLLCFERMAPGKAPNVDYKIIKDIACPLEQEYEIMINSCYEL